MCFLKKMLCEILLNSSRRLNVLNLEGLERLKLHAGS